MHPKAIAGAPGRHDTPADRVLRRWPAARVLSVVLAVVLALASLATGSPASAAVPGSGSARCDALAGDWIGTASARSATQDAPGQASYRTHFNQRLGRCLALETVNRQMRSPALRRVMPRQTQRLWDVEQDRNLGEYDAWQGLAPITCTLEATQCKSRQEWEGLLHPFLAN